VLPGSIDWYYVIALPTLYANVALLLSRLVMGGWVRVAVVSLTTTQTLITLLTLTGAVSVFIFTYSVCVC
jgi:hypothetical protein